MAYQEECEDSRSLNARSIVNNREGNDDRPRVAVRVAQREGLRKQMKRGSARKGSR